MHRSASYTPSMMVNAKKYLSDRPQLIDCPQCKHHGETEVRFVVGLFTWISFLVILIAGVFILPLFFLWVPFMIETFKDAEHRCPSSSIPRRAQERYKTFRCQNCKTYIGTFRRIGKST